MKQLLVTFLLMLATAGVSAGEPQDNEPRFDKYWMVFLVRPETPSDYGKERNAELQREHLEHLTWLWEQGYALVAGPFGTSPDDPLRGLVLLRGDLDQARARELAERDPRVKAGQLQVEVRRWFTGAGILAFPKSPPSVTSD